MEDDLAHDHHEQPGILRGRRTVEIMVLLLTATVCLFILASGGVITFVVLTRPGTDVNTVMQSLIGIISTILGALLGLLVGRAVTPIEPMPDTESWNSPEKRP